MNVWQYEFIHSNRLIRPSSGKFTAFQRTTLRIESIHSTEQRTLLLVVAVCPTQVRFGGLAKAAAREQGGCIITNIPATAVVAGADITTPWDAGPIVLQCPYINRNARRFAISARECDWVRTTVQVAETVGCLAQGAEVVDNGNSTAVTRHYHSMLRRPPQINRQ